MSSSLSQHSTLAERDYLRYNIYYNICVGIFKLDLIKVQATLSVDLQYN